MRWQGKKKGTGGYLACCRKMKGRAVWSYATVLDMTTTGSFLSFFFLSISLIVITLFMSRRRVRSNRIQVAQRGAWLRLQLMQQAKDEVASQNEDKQKKVDTRQNLLKKKIAPIKRDI